MDMSLSTWICLVGSFQSLGLAAYMKRHRPHAWSVQLDATFFARLLPYSGIVTSGIKYCVQGVVMKTMGPVFVTAFNPLRMIIVTILASFLLLEQLLVGIIIGGVVVTVGLYQVAWGKYKEYKLVMPPSPAKDTLQLPVKIVNDRKSPESVVISYQTSGVDSTIPKKGSPRSS